VGGYASKRTVEQISQAAMRGIDLVAFWQAARAAIRDAVPHYITPCWYTLDPASLLVTSHYDHGLIPQLPHDWLAHEYQREDYHKLADVARSERGISTLHELTGGDPARSPHWNTYVRPIGGEQQLYLALRTRSGENWGILALYREPGQPMFTRAEFELLRELAPHLAEGARRALLIGAAADPEGPEAPGLVVLDESWQVQSLTPGVERWLERLPGDWTPGGQLPQAVIAVAARALQTAGPDHPGEVALARVLSRDGRWIVLHGATLLSDGVPRAAVILEPAHPARISPLLMSAYTLTEREQDLTRHVLCGESTAEIAAALCISAHTVQQHLKSIFEKTGVRSRRDLVGKIFFAHYEPRLRDNEQRAILGRPLRDGPQ